MNGQNRATRAIAIVAATLILISGCAGYSDPPRAYHVVDDSFDICNVWATHTECFRQDRDEFEREMNLYHESLEISEQDRLED